MAKGDGGHVPPVPVGVRQAVRALGEGKAAEHQQQLALNWILLDLCGVKDSCFREGKPDTTAFLEGRRFVGLILAKVMTEKFNMPKGESNG